MTGATLVAVSACGTSVPDSGAGVGFQDYTDFAQERAARDAELSGTTVLPPVGEERDDLVTVTTDGALTGQAERGAAPTNVIQPNNSSISDENDFAAVSDRQSIESDAERLAQQRAQYQVIQPTALPSRSAGGANIVEYALSSTNSVGQSLYRRSAFSTEAKFLRNCAAFPSSDMAQIEFLNLGGPERDRKGMDPDGDGFACAWDPAPFRQARASASAAADAVILETPLN